MSSEKYSGRMSRLAGYAALVENYELDVIPHWHSSMVFDASGLRKTVEDGGSVDDFFPVSYWPGDRAVDHLEFALKYDGVNLGVLAGLFDKVPEDELLEYVKSKPTGKYARIIWYLYEFISGRQLLLPDMKLGSYVDLLDPGLYYVSSVSRDIKRQRVRDNMLGSSAFCPIVRRTETLRQFEAADYSEHCRRLVDKYPEDIIRRGFSYMYSKESKSSFEIEGEGSKVDRIQLFMAALRRANEDDFCDKEKLVKLQRQTVDPRFACDDYRSSQNYVGQTVYMGNERIHYVSPRPEDLPELMAGLLRAHEIMKEADVYPVVHAAVIAYGFVFMHPFEDGNGRIHRFLIHNVLALRGFTPKGATLPLSAVMLNNLSEYDASLESFSLELMARVKYRLNDEGTMQVENDTANLYRYIDMTAQVEALFKFIEKAVTVDLEEQFKFLQSYDSTVRDMQGIVDMPNKKIDLFIKCCLQNHGTLSKSKRNSHFAVLTAEEVDKMQQVVCRYYELAERDDG